jgi:hypothetical protein
LDDVLDPTDKEELAQKIESSDFAKDLVHQTRDSVRRLRLSAPQVLGTGMGMDPNTVAEYLDNALPPEQVGDYERICLESDVHLAETAACHHVLTMVLGEPAEVEPRSRQRMYMIPAESRERRRLRAEPAHSRSPLATTVAVAAAPAAAVTAGPARPVPATNAYEIPEYLRNPAWWRSRAVVAALAAVLVVGAALYFISDLMGWLGGAPNVAVVDADAQPNVSESKPRAEVAQTETTPVPAQPAPTTPVTDVIPRTTSELGTAPETTATAEPIASAPSAEPGVGDGTPATVDAGAIPATTADQPATSVVESSPPENPATTSIAAGPASTVADETPPADPSVTASPLAAATPDTATATVAPSSPGDAPPDAGASPAAEAAAVTPPQVADVGSDAEVVPQGPAELGTYLSGKTVLLRYDQPKGGWFRAEPRSAVVAGERLLSLPEFRPQITLASGMMLDMAGGTQVVLLSGDEANGPGQGTAAIPTIEVLYGRIILLNPSNAETRVRLKAGTNNGEARLGRNATLAFQVERPYVPGNDPRTTPVPVVATMICANGSVTWTDASGEIAINKPSQWKLVEGAPAEVVADAETPDWIDREPVVHLSEQKYGAPEIEGTLVSDRPVDIQLLELFKGRERREVKSLVTRCSIHVGLFSPFIDALRDSDQKWPTWRTHIETLRAAMAQSPESAEQVFKSLVDQRGRPAAGDLYEMLCGYNAAQIGSTPEARKTGAIARLIDWLEQDSLDYRVLAVYDLLEITGKQLMQNPAASPATRKINVRNWRNRLESGELEPLTPGEGKERVEKGV